MYAVPLCVCSADLVRYVFMHHVPTSRYDLHLKLAWSHAGQKTRKTAVMYTATYTQPTSPHLTSPHLTSPHHSNPAHFTPTSSPLSCMPDVRLCNRASGMRLIPPHPHPHVIQVCCPFPYLYATEPSRMRLRLCQHFRVV